MAARAPEGPAAPRATAPAFLPAAPGAAADRPPGAGLLSAWAGVQEKPAYAPPPGGNSQARPSSRWRAGDSAARQLPLTCTRENAPSPKEQTHGEKEETP